MRMERLRAALGASLFAASATTAAIDREPIDQGILDERQLPALEEASGFIVDRTITHFGAEFVRSFSEAWREHAGTTGIDVTIVERPSARYGSLVWVEHNGRPIVRMFLYAGRAGTIRPAAVAAAQYVARQVADESLARLLLNDPDLAKDGF
jgi:curli production assembly/transport component CsgE